MDVFLASVLSETLQTTQQRCCSLQMSVVEVPAVTGSEPCLRHLACFASAKTPFGLKKYSTNKFKDLWDQVWMRYAMLQC